MEKYVLTQDLVTGNELIDSEHRKIFDEVNTLLDACSKGKGRENLSSLGEFLVEYVTKHFSDEEDLQKQSKYPEYTEHHKFHEWYKQKLGDAIIKLEQEGPTINSLGEINYMVSVLVKHIRETDRKLAQWIQNGAKNEVTASKVATGSAVSGKTSYMDTVTKDESTENLDIRHILDMKELQRIQDLFLTATGMTAAVVDMKGKYIIRGSSFTSFYSRYTSGKHNELREFTQDLTVGGFRAGTVIGGIVLGDYPGDSAPSQEVVSASGQLLAEMLNLWANALYYRKSNADSVEAFAKEEKKVRDAVGQIKYKAKGLEQTATMEKMLSLNAAIEAGRAGKAGVGFGVVADEIGRMANESAAVYQEIQELVKQVEESMERLGE